MPTQPTTNQPIFLGKGQFAVTPPFTFLSNPPEYTVFAPPVTSTGKGPIYVNPNAGHIA
jgi:hypothetical protein